MGLAGLMGAGRTEVVRALVGQDQASSGEIYLEGKRLRVKNVRDAINSGVMMISEDRKRYEIFPNRSVKENASIVILRKFCKGSLISIAKERVSVGGILKKMNAKFNTMNDLIQALSGGNQQKVVLSKWLLAEPKVLILDEPTRGIDVGAKYEIYNLIVEMAKRGIAIVLISSELNEVINMSHKLYLMRKGQIVGMINNKEDYSEEPIFRVLAGGER